MPSYEPPICLKCAHYDWEDQEKMSCKAFPKGIPKAITQGEHDHKVPYKGDKGIQYRARRGT